MTTYPDNAALREPSPLFSDLCKAKGIGSASKLHTLLRDTLPSERLEALGEALTPAGLTNVALGAFWHGTGQAPALLWEEVTNLPATASTTDHGEHHRLRPGTTPPDTEEPPAGWGIGSAKGIAVSARTLAERIAEICPAEEFAVFATVAAKGAEFRNVACSWGDIVAANPVLDTVLNSGGTIYLSSGSFQAGVTKRDNSRLSGVWSIVLDDVGTHPSKSKVPWCMVAALGLTPSVIVRTSPDNHQVYFFLQSPERDLARVSWLLRSLAAKGLMDPGSARLSQFFRLPGVSTKPESAGHRDVICMFAPDASYCIDDIGTAAGLTIPAAGSPDLRVVTRRVASPELLWAPGADDEERVAWVKRAFQNIRNDWRFPDRETWLRAGFAIHGACNGDPGGFDVFDEWSERHYSYDPDATLRFWESIDASQHLGCDQIMIWLAEDAGRKPRELAEQKASGDQPTDPPDDAEPENGDEQRRALAALAACVFARAPVVIAETLDAITPLRPGSLRDNAAPNIPGGPSGSHGAANNANMAHHRWEAWEQALQRLESARTAPRFADVGSIMTGGLLAFNPSDTRPRPIRPDITDFLTRGQVTLLYSAPAVGKSTFVAAVAVALAWEKPDLLGLPGMDWAGDVMVLSNEDGHAVLMDKFTGIVRSSGLLPAEKKHDVLVVPGSSTSLVEQVAGGAVVPTLAGIRFVETLAERHRVSGSAHGVGLLVIDTLATITAGLNENDAGAMQTAMNVLNDIARRGFLAVLVLHHTAKAAGSSGAVDMFSARGSGAIVASARMAVPMRWPTDDEARKFGWGDTAKAAGTRYVVFDGPAGKANGIAAGLRYYERTSYSLPAWDVRETGAGGVLPPLTISVPVLKPIFPQNVVRATPDQTFAHLRTEIATRGRVRHDTGRGKAAPPDGSDTASLVAAFGMSAVEARALVAGLLKAGRIETETARCKKAKRNVPWLVMPPPDEDEI